MEATIVDLRYRMKDVLAALRRNEDVTVLYHGKPVGVLKPIEEQTQKTQIKDHPFFGMDAEDNRPVEDIMEELRGGRCRDI